MTENSGPSAQTAEPRALRVVGIAASAGGLEALTALLQGLPEDPGLALVLVLHLAPDRASGVAEVLSRATQLPVCEVQHGMPVERNHVYVIPPNTELTMARGALWLGPRRSGPGHHKPADVFLQSLAQEQTHRAIGVVLSGGDQDGTEGLRAIKQRGGITFAQDETAKIQSMPRSSVHSGVVDFVLPPAAIAGELVHLAARPPPEILVGAETGIARPPEAVLGDDELAEIVHLLRDASGVDFTHYKPSTIRRRILRRMGIQRIDRVADFTELLRGSRAELDSLQADILIHVTSFFRDPAAFHALQTQVIPRLIDRAPQDPIRIWVAGCASGEEAYSVAICLLEALGDAASSTHIQIFGTDLSEAAIAKARLGVYAADIAAEVTPERLRSFFVRTELGYQISKNVRDLCVFAQHDVAHDPPFSHLDLVSCRNLLIYLSPPLQKRVVPLLHYALKPGGYLFLGSAESLGAVTAQFAPVDKPWNLYAKAGAATEPGAEPAHPQHRGATAPRRARISSSALPREIDAQREADRVLAGAYAPPGVVIDDRMAVLHFRGRTGAYLEPPQGKANLHLLSMARAGIQAAISTAVRGSLEKNAPTEAQGRVEGEGPDVRIRVTPLGTDASSGRRSLLVVFEQAAVFSATPTTRLPEVATEADAEALARARQELDALRLQMLALIEGHEAAHEELQSANEEVLSSNEELQSTNEELETAKEELQSTNEELSTINDELQARVRELGGLNDDLANVLSSAHIPIVIVGSDLRIRRFTSAAAPLFHLIAADIGRPLDDIRSTLVLPDLIALVTEVVESLAGRTQDVQDRSGRWYTLRLRPYRTRENKIDGVILTLTDIDETKRALEYAEAIITTVQTPLLVLDAGLNVRRANREFYRTFYVSAKETERRRIYELGNGQWNIPALRELLEEVIPRDREFSDFEVQQTFPYIGPRTMRVNARRIEGAAGAGEQILVAIDDVTQQKHDESLLHLADVRKNEFLAMLAHELRNPLAPVVHAARLLGQPELERPGIQRAVEIITRQTARMSRLIDDLLDVSRITRGMVELRKERVDLRAMIEAAVEAHEPRMRERRQEFHCSIPPEPVWLDADPVRLEQIVSNLLSNAAKYTDDGGRIELRVERDCGWALVRIRDTGVGIARDMLAQVFELFTQEKLSNSTDGLGIGLTVVRSLVELHGGSVVADSAGRGQGSEFVVRLPVLYLPAAAGAATTPVADASPRRAAGLRILVVEDNPDAAEMLSALLKAWGHEVQAAANGPAALEAVQTMRPETILLDVGLPGMSGYELARELRKQPELQGTRIVAMTGFGQDADRARSREAGFDEHLVKPVSPETLREVLTRAPRA